MMLAYISHICCKYFILMCVCFAMATHVFFPDVLDVCYKYLNCFRIYITNILSRCYKRKSWCCISCNGTYLQQPSDATVRAGCGGDTRVRARVTKHTQTTERRGRVRMLDVPFCI
jgi:hypothetical protein